MSSPPADSLTSSSSRAVKIPHRDGMKAYSSGTARQRRSARHIVLDNLSDPSDVGASSFSSEDSYPDSRHHPSTMFTHSTAFSSASRMPVDDAAQSLHFQSYSPTSSSSSAENYGSQTHFSKQKARAVEGLDPPNTMPSFFTSRSSPLGPSMLSSHTYRSINLNGPDPDEPPRLITFTKAGQGFSWNEELFLPSYMISRYSRSRRKQYDGDLGEDDVEVAEIFITDEEASKMMP